MGAANLRRAAAAAPAAAAAAAAAAATHRGPMGSSGGGGDGDAGTDAARVWRGRVGRCAFVSTREPNAPEGSDGPDSCG